MYNHRIYYLKENIDEGRTVVSSFVGKELTVQVGKGIFPTNFGVDAPNPLKYWVEWTSEFPFSDKEIRKLLALCPPQWHKLNAKEDNNV
jgi:hypothetical protein